MNVLKLNLPALTEDKFIENIDKDDLIRKSSGDLYKRRGTLHRAEC